ncbi:hypothetical protein [Nonomuraea jabiensis]|uniref:Uncharacterized protein n=1 Tax=Nonomuraea jabiensis TaxID=882448 RepID=A0A7W9GC70_9ACTN|nr:hypothetical protein [Nonomuraea jabiensis]MBB5781074.1 hypothetical protein [Nonomuraea jabiensis]
MSSAILIAGENSLSVEVTNPTATVPWGRWETYQKQGGVSDQGTAILLGQAALERASEERVQLTRQIRPYAARWLPFEDYRVGDFVLAPGDGAAMESLRVRQITLSSGADGVIGGNLVRNDRFLETDSSWPVRPRASSTAASPLAGPAPTRPLRRRAASRPRDGPHRGAAGPCR